MQTTRTKHFLVLALGAVLSWSGCGGNSADDKPTVIVPDVPPADEANNSMKYYLKAHPNAAKKAAKSLQSK